MRLPRELAGLDMRNFARRSLSRRGTDAALIAVVVFAWIVLMVGPYRALRGSDWDFEIAGTAAEWTGGLFTGLAVLVALRAFLREKQQSAEELALGRVRGVAAYAET